MLTVYPHDLTPAQTAAALLTHGLELRFFAVIYLLYNGGAETQAEVTLFCCFSLSYNSGVDARLELRFFTVFNFLYNGGAGKRQRLWLSVMYSGGAVMHGLELRLLVVLG